MNRPSPGGSPDHSAAGFDLQSAMTYIEALTAEATPPAAEPWELPDGRVQPTVGWAVAALLDVLVRSRRPRRVLEIGTSFGYSACALGQAAATYGGQVLSVEIADHLATVARRNIAARGLDATVTVAAADAREHVRTLEGPFGLILQDGGKEDYLPLLERLVDLLEPGGLLVSDDALFPVMDIPPQVKHWSDAIAAYNHVLANHPRLRTAWLPVGDGIAISVRKA